MNYEKCIRKNT